MSHRRFSRVSRGFTIIELVVVVSLVGIMMAIMVPKLRISEKTEVQLAGMQLAQDVDVSRTRALSTRARVRVAFHASQREYGGYLDHDGDSTIVESDQEWQALRGFGVRDLPTRVKYGRGAASAIPGDAASGAVTFSDARVEFDARGLTMPMGARGVVYLVSETDPYAVVAVQVMPSGSVRLWSFTTSGGWQ